MERHACGADCFKKMPNWYTDAWKQNLSLELEVNIDGLWQKVLASGNIASSCKVEIVNIIFQMVHIQF